ncbi:MAG: response regulator transcription factor [Acidimicrobiales bacterium]|jgi:DNA-binding NarL/FixJ family response regulator
MPEAVVPERTRVLLADDDPTMLVALGDLLTTQGYEVVATAEDGQSALALIQQYRPDVAILDLRMPQMSGTEVASALADQGVEVPVIMFSAFDDPQLQIEAEGLGVVEYLVKGCSSREIIKTIESCAPRK